MILIGMLLENKRFENLKNELIKNIKTEKLNIININKQNIQNMKNIKFETIVIDDSLEKMKEEKEIINQIGENSKYILLNSDLAYKLDILKDKKIKIITYGLNQKATVTVSSITEEKVLVAVQRNIENNKGQIIEMEEKEINLMENKKLKIYDILLKQIFINLYK